MESIAQRKPMDIQVGDTFDRWTVLKAPERPRKGNTKVWCQCKCGAEGYVAGGMLLLGKSRSCGCFSAERSTKHGESHSRLYHVYTSMKGRCHNQNDSAYKNYGGRGIVVCEEWQKSFSSFQTWANKSGYEQRLDIDRCDNNGPYSPENCRFVTRSVNAKNKRNNIYLCIFGEEKIISEWCFDKRCVVKSRVFRLRIQRGWDAEVALVTPPIPLEVRYRFRSIVTSSVS